MRASVMEILNPFDPLGSRVAREIRRPLRVRTLAPRTPRPMIAMLNGRPLLRAGWRRRLRDGDQLAFIVLPRGGGGGGSNPLQMVATMALMAFAPWAAAHMLGFANVGAMVAAGSMMGQVTTVGIMMTGSALISALMPVPSGPQMQQPSPTYSLEAQGNMARIGQAIPVQYGRLLAYPDFAAQPWADYAGNEQYLYQLLCLGAGRYDIEEIRIEDTPISAFSEVETEIVPPGGEVTLFPTQVTTSVEVSGQEMPWAKTGRAYSQTGTTVTITEGDHGRAVGQAVRIDPESGTLAAGVYTIASAPSADTFRITAGTSATTSGTLQIRTVMGGASGFVANAAGTVATGLGIDILFPAGLYYYYGDGNMHSRGINLHVEIQRINAAGEPLDGWKIAGDWFWRRMTVTPQRESLNIRLPTPGRYRVRAWRDNEAGSEPETGNMMLWAGLRAYLREEQDWGDVTLIALRMRATNNLSLQASRRISVLATRKLPVWNGASWSAPVATTSIAWAIADAARNTEHGARLPDARIDLDALLALDAVWSARGDAFNGRFDSSASWWEAASRIALAGRARIYLQGGKLRVVRDGAAAAPVALFSMHNIRSGSFGIDYLVPSDDTADAVEVAYYDESTWTPRKVRAKLPNSTAARPAPVELFGVTSRAQALREGMYHAACNRYRRRIVRFGTEMQGFLPSIGDPIAIQHDMPGWGAHAEAVAWSGASRTLTLSEPVTFGTGTHYVGWRLRNGRLAGPYAVSPGDVATEVVLAEAPDTPPDTGSDRDRSAVVFGGATSWRVMAKVASVRPKSLTEVEIEAVIEDPSVHTAETGEVAPPIRLGSLPRRTVAPVVRDLMGARVPGDSTRAMISWPAAVGAEIYQVEVAFGFDPASADATWTRAGDTTSAHYILTMVDPKRTLIRVRGVGLAAGPWRAAAIGSLIPRFWNPLASTPIWVGDLNAMWST